MLFPHQDWGTGLRVARGPWELTSTIRKQYVDSLQITLEETFSLLLFLMFVFVFSAKYVLNITVYKAEY